MNQERNRKLAEISHVSSRSGAVLDRTCGCLREKGRRRGCRWRMRRWKRSMRSRSHPCFPNLVSEHFTPGGIELSFKGLNLALQDRDRTDTSVHGVSEPHGCLVHETGRRIGSLILGHLLKSITAQLSTVKEVITITVISLGLIGRAYRYHEHLGDVAGPEDFMNGSEF